MGSFAEGLIGVVLDGRYRLDAVLGEGGMGSVFRAQHLAIDRKVAIKLLKPHLTADRTALERFAREARSTLKVESPHAVKVLDFGITPQNDYYIALEYLDGRTVQKELEIDGPFAPLRVLHIARQALHALGAAHKSGLVHRDIKPDNILLMRVGDDPDYAKLLDFGVAKLMEGAAVTPKSELKLTAAGMVFGTPEFMSPEQACGHPLDARSDLYSLAATMFAMLTGCGLFEGRTAIEWLMHHARTPAPHLADLQPELAKFPTLDEVLQRCLAKHRDQRPSTAAELDGLLAELETYVARGGQSRTPRGKARFRTALSASAYFPALPPETVDAGETIVPSGPLAAIGGPPPMPSDGPGAAPPLANPVRPSAPTFLDETGLTPAVSPRRGLYLALGAVVVLAVLSLAIGVAVTKRSSSGSTSVSDAPVRTSVAPADASVPPSRADAAEVSVPVDAGVVVAASVPVDAAVARPVHDGRPTQGKPSRNPELDEHLQKAEAALRAGNRLRQLAEADLAFRADPRSVRARYLLADALIKGGDLDRGCAHLHALGRNPLAVARARSAGCPTD